MSSTSPKSTKTPTKTTRAKTSKAKPATPKTTKPIAAKATPKTPPAPKAVTALAAVPPAPQAVIAEPKLVEPQVPVIAGPAMKKKELIDTVTERMGAKKKDVKPVVEAILEVLGDALAEDRELNLPPFAKMRIQRVKQLRAARVTIARLRQPRSAEAQDAAE